MLAFLYWMLRAGFSDNSLLDVIKVVGISALILLTPSTLSSVRSRFSDSVNRIFFSESIIAVYLILLIAGLGFVPFDLSIILAVVGYFLSAKALLKLLRHVRPLDILFVISISVFLGMWVGGVTWLWYLKPLGLANSDRSIAGD